MASTIDPKLGVNSWLEDELYQQYLHDRKAVDADWKGIFEAQPPASVAIVAPAPTPVKAVAPSTPAIDVGPAEQLVPLRGAAMRLAENMSASLSIPVATSQRTIPVKVIDENRPDHKSAPDPDGKGKISYTHIIGWAIVQALKSNPSLNHAYRRKRRRGIRLVRNQINLGVAVDVAGKDGNRALMVPNLKNAGSLTFTSTLPPSMTSSSARARAS